MSVGQPEASFLRDPAEEFVWRLEQDAGAVSSPLVRAGRTRKRARRGSPWEYQGVVFFAGTNTSPMRL